MDNELLFDDRYENILENENEDKYKNNFKKMIEKRDEYQPETIESDYKFSLFNDQASSFNNLKHCACRII